MDKQELEIEEENTYEIEQENCDDVSGDIRAYLHLIKNKCVNKNIPPNSMATIIIYELMLFIDNDIDTNRTIEEFLDESYRVAKLAFNDLKKSD